MERPGGKKPMNMIIVSLLELMGTAMILIAFAGAQGGALGVSIMLFACIIVFGDISGGHFNPAVTLGVYIRQSYVDGAWLFNLGYSALIISSQIVGAFIGSFLGVIQNTPPHIVEKDKQLEWILNNFPILCPGGYIQIMEYDRTD